MKGKLKLIIPLIILLSAPVVIGLFQPKERMVTAMTMVDKMYFFIMADITNHWEEPSWRHNLDTIIQQQVVDGQDAWMEHYSNGDSILLITQKVTETDYIRIIYKEHTPQLMRVITLADYKGKTAIRMSEEAYETNPIKRFISLFNDPVEKRIKTYLADLKEKNKPDPNATDDDSVGW
jgi:hypothetical protein